MTLDVPGKMCQILIRYRHGMIHCALPSAMTDPLTHQVGSVTRASLPSQCKITILAITLLCPSHAYLSSPISKAPVCAHPLNIHHSMALLTIPKCRYPKMEVLWGLMNRRSHRVKSRIILLHSTKLHYKISSLYGKPILRRLASIPQQWVSTSLCPENQIINEPL